MAGGGTATEVVGVQMPTGEVLWARIAVDPSAVTDSAAGFEHFLGRVEKLDETIRGVVHSVGASIARYAPAETEIEFGIEVAGKTGAAFAVLAGAQATASVKVKLTWRKGEFPAGLVAAAADASAPGAGQAGAPEPAPQPESQPQPQSEPAAEG